MSVKNNDRANDPKVLRLKQIFEENGFKSVNAFCRFLNCSQPTTYNYICGYRVPSSEYMLMLSKAFKQYNLDWVVYGTGEKYNPEYVDVRKNRLEVVGQPVQIVNKPEPTIEQPQQQPISGSVALMSQKLADMGERMATMAEKLASWTEKCSTLESQLKSALEVIEEYKKEKEQNNK